MTLKKQKALIEQDDWDILIILDATRYDYFKIEYKKYLPEGRLYEVECDPGGGWAYHNFTRKYDADYFTANPNARPISAFNRVVDIWKVGWSEKLGTVPPWEVNRAVLNDSWDRAVIHYLQPHGPWIGKHSLYKPSKLRRHLGGDVELIPILKSKPVSFLHQIYIDNLRLVLKYVSALLESISGHVVITSDHGEALGEEGRYLHTPMYSSPEIRHVPWCEIHV